MSWRALGAVAALVILTTSAIAADTKHFNPKGKPASKFTTEKQESLRKSLPFADKRDEEEQKRGFIAAPPYKQIKKDDGTVALGYGCF